jgi:3-methylcrotonyl-CoA carboxylase alpha subunit
MKFSYRRAAEDEHTVEVEIVPLEGSTDRYQVTVGTQRFELSAGLLQRLAFYKQSGVITVQVEGKEYCLFEAAQQRRSHPQPQGDLHAPMAGKVIRVLVRPGEQVRAGTPLIILEAMKMEQTIVAPQDGVITQVLCQEGEQVAAGRQLVALTSDAASSPVPVFTQHTQTGQS